MNDTVHLNVKIPKVYRFALQELSLQESEHISVIVRRLIREEAKNKNIWPASSHDSGGSEEVVIVNV